jgi:hypothetical protein
MLENCWKIVGCRFLLRKGKVFILVFLLRRCGDLAVGVGYMTRIIEVDAEDLDMKVTARA